MINLELSNILSNISEVSRYRSPDRNFVSGLSKTARTIRDYPGDIRNLYYEGKLKELDGIDEVAYGFIQEYFEHGKIGAYEELKSAYSEELVKLVRISGLGAKMVFGVYGTLGIKNLSDLKNLLGSKDIYGKSRFLNIERGKGSIVVTGFHMRRLKEALNYYEKIRSLFPRWYVENFIEEIKTALRKISDIENFKLVGSFRRKKLFIGDIDILILPSFNLSHYDLEKSEKLLKRLSSLGFVQELKERKFKNKNISARFKTTFGIDVEFIVSSYKNWVLDLFYTTGSKTHIKKVEEIARERGYFESGRVNVETGNSEKMATKFLGNHMVNGGKDLDKFNFNSYRDCEDKIIYDLLGLQFIPPELREDLGEIELSKKASLPILVELKDIKGDLHIHSRWSDATMDFEDIFQKAKEYNYEYVAISDHSTSNIYGNGLDVKKLLDKIKDVRELNLNAREVEFLVGSEVEIRENKKLDYEEDILEKIDIAIGAMHSGFANSARENTQRVLGALKHKKIDFIAHPTGVVFGNRAPLFIDMDKLIDGAFKNNKALEINSYFLRLDLDEKNVRKAKEKGIKIVINTDSHRLNNIDMIRLGVDIARRAGLEKKDILNCMSLKDIKKWKKQR